MFEGKPLVAQHAYDSVHGRFADDELIAFEWGDLVARLSASRELRAALAHVPATARASFDALAAEHLIVLRDVPAESAAAESNSVMDAVPSLLDNEQRVNLVASGNGKEARAKKALDVDGVRSGPRGIA